MARWARWLRRGSLDPDPDFSHSQVHEHVLMGLAREHMPMGLAHEHRLVGLAHEHVPMGQAHEHVLMEPDAGPDELKSCSGQHIRPLEFAVAKSKIWKEFENQQI